MEPITFSGAVAWEITGGSPTMQAAAHILMNSDMDAKSAYQAAQVKMSTKQLPVNNAKTVEAQVVADASVRTNTVQR